MMRRSRNVALIVVMSLCWIGFAGAGEIRTENPRVRLVTGMGDIVLELNPAAAPATVENFLTYVKDGFYNGTVFHRVIKGFMIQGGGFTPDLQQKPTREAIKNEAESGLKNQRGSIAMARTPDPHSATAQFFINTVDNAFLNFRDKSAQGWGYCVFGKVVEGMETVDSIAAVSTTTARIGRDVPVEAVVIKRADIIAAGDTGKKPVTAPEPEPDKNSML